MVAHYADSESYDNFIGEFLSDHNREQFPAFRSLRTSHKKLIYTFSQTTSRKGEFLNVQHVGPFNSTGGFDWWQFNGADAGQMSQVLEAYGKIFILGYTISAVDASDEMISFPPIYMHHAHVTPARPRLRFQGEPTYKANYVLEKHGDIAGDILEPRGYGRLVDFSLDFDLELNDKRPSHAVPLTWLLRIGIRWTSGTHALTPLSCMNILNAPSRPFDENHQMSIQGFFLTESYAKRVFWYSGQVHARGRLVYMRPHNHLPSLVKGYLFRGGVHQTGMHLFDRPLKTIYEPNAFYLKHSPFGSLAEFEAYLLRFAGHHVVCMIEPSFVFRDGRAYGHGYKAINCSDWRFDETDWFTSVSLVDQVRDGSTLPKYVPLHAHWIMIYTRPEEISRYEIDVVYNNHMSYQFGAQAILHENQLSQTAPQKYVYASILAWLCLVKVLALWARMQWPIKLYLH